MDKNKKCKDCNKRLQYNNKTGYCCLCEIKYQVCKICGKKISACAFRRTGLCHSCGCAKQDKTKNENNCKNCNRNLHTNNKSGYCRSCMTELSICKKCGNKTGDNSFRNTRLCHRCSVIEGSLKRKLPDEFCVDCGNKLKTRNRSKFKLCKECSGRNEFRKKNSFRSGIFNSRKNNIELFYASSYELRTFELLENDESVVSFARCPYIIKYFYENKNRKYYPDVLVNRSNGDKDILEIKPYYLLTNEKVLAKANAATEFCDENNMRYRIVTEKDLFKESI